MAIDRTRINSLDAGATKSPSGSSIKYEGDIVEPQMKMAAWEGSPGMDSREEVRRAWKDYLKALQEGTFTGTWEQFMPLWIKGNLASAQGGMEPMSAAQGGIAGYRGGQLVKPGPGRPGYNGWQSDFSSDWGGEATPSRSSGGNERASGPAEGPPQRQPTYNVVQTAATEVAPEPTPSTAISPGQSQAMVGDTSLAGFTQDVGESLVKTGLGTASADRYAGVVTGDGAGMEEVYSSPDTGPIYTGTEDLEEQLEIDKAWAYNKGLIQNDPITGEEIPGRNVRNEAGVIVPREDTITSPVTGGGDEDPGTDAPVSTGGITAAGPAVPTTMDPFLAPNLMEGSVQLAKGLPERLIYGPEPRNPPLMFPAAHGGRAGYHLGDIVRQNRAEFGAPRPFTRNEDEDEWTYPWNMNRGGRVPAAFGGIMGSDGRRAYGLGSLNPFKAVKKVGKAIKKVAKSDLGKAALIAAGVYFSPQIASYLGGTGWGKATAAAGKAFRPGSFMGQLTSGNRLAALQTLMPGGKPAFPGAPLTSKEIFYGTQESNLNNAYTAFNEAKTAGNTVKMAEARKKIDLLEPLVKKGIETVSSVKAAGTGSKLAQAAIWGIPALSMTKWGQELGKPVYDPNTMTMEEYEAQVAEWKQKNLAGLGSDAWQLPGTLPSTLQYSAQGGRIGYSEGGDEAEWRKIYNKYKAKQIALGQEFTDFDDFVDQHRVHEAQGGRIGAQEGGLMDLGGMEKDYREEGGFVPIGGQERADDVPARLSKNEFVFTADAVRAAGGGDIDAGAEVMENVMENLERGGQVSEESQGLEGARNMFATAQRLEGVM